MAEQAKLDRKLWQDPPAEYRPAPFWMWNYEHDVEELKRQVREMKAHGFGGFFMHARTGLVTPYLGKEWFAQIRATVEEAERLGMQAWIYDEDRWPSGFAGGQIAGVEGLDYAAHALQCREEGGKRVIEVVRSGPSRWLNGACGPDLLNPEVIAAWLELTHERYRKAVGKHFGKVVPGSFTDEPSYILWDREDRFELLPWTKGFEELFRERRGYDLKPHLASLFFAEGDWRRIRLDYYRTITERFVESFSKQIYDWCDRRKLATTGHVMMEDHLIHQVRATGASMPQYEYFHVPGIDHLGDTPNTEPLLQKQCASAAHQLGRRRVLTESFGGAGWEQPMGVLKPSGDNDWAYGMNYLCQHLYYYTIKGCRKRDYPSTCSYHLPGFPLYKAFNDYFARLSYALSQGERVCGLLVLHPISSVWALYSPREPEAAQEVNDSFAALSQLLLDLQRDYEFGDEMLMEKHARVEGRELVIGEGRYEVVIVPGAENWSANTFRLLREFAAAGGTIISCGPPAQYLEGKLSPELEGFLRGKGVRKVAKATHASLEKALGDIVREVEVRDAGGKLIQELVYQRRQVGEREVYFLSCGRAAEEFTAEVALAGVGRVELWDADTAQVTELPARAEAGRTVFSLRFPKGGSNLVALDTSRPPAKARTRAAEQRRPLEGQWEIERLDPNVLLLDQVQVKFGESPWTQPMAIQGEMGPTALPNAQDLLRNAHDDERLWPSWPVRLRWEFAAELPEAERVPAWLAVEDTSVLPGLELNGRALRGRAGAWWLDRHFRRLEATGALKPGLNRIESGLRWERPTEPGTLIFRPGGTELENSFLLGEFHVAWDGKRRLKLVPAAELPSDPTVDLTRAGLPFYHGRVAYRLDFTLPEVERGRRYVLRCGRPHGEGLRVSVNGKRCRDLWCEPWEADCTRLLRPGANRVEVLLYSNPGNLLGIIHHRSPWVDVAHYIPEYLLQPLGLGEAPELVVR